ncbi:DUF1080 domain-containing protein [Niabella sp. CC-SYL272]|uniref:3-keto-disaccharide hydrolase n=1 Tax=Niabella agricola TaxID=2891571 RepID=UPI001F1ECE40|nr:DUF1080 domain-containing protein [Niabella agricola]MCF3110006.1 DUF1080 domain-containing protein [Niabella agricola]
MRILFLTLLSAVSFFSNAQENFPRKWVQLFNGRDLSGWTPKITGYAYGDNYGNTFRVVDKKLTVNYDHYKTFNDRFGHLFYKTPFSYYLLAVEYRFVGKQNSGAPGWAYKNSGVMIHCQPPATMGKDQDFPISIEVQLLGGDSTGERSTCNLCTPGTNVEMNGKLVTQHCINSTSKTFRNEEWVRAEILVLGDSVVKHIANGDTVLVYQKPQIGGGSVTHFDPAVKKDGQLLQSGYISLQSEGHPIEFRKVEIIDLSPYYDKKSAAPTSRASKK